MYNEYFLSAENLHEYRLQLKKRHFLCLIEDNCNTDEVSALYRCISEISVDELHVSYSFVRFKDRLTVVLTFLAYGLKSPLTIIGKSKRSGIIHRYMDTYRNLWIFYYAKSNDWNTRALWETMVRIFSKMGHLQGRKLGLLLDNFSAH